MSEVEGGDADDDAEEGESSRRAAKSHSSSSATGERRTRAKVSDDDDVEDSEEGSDCGAPSERHLNHRCEVYDSHRYCAAAAAAAATTTVTNTLFLPYFGPFWAQLSIIFTFLFQLAEHSIVVSQFSVSIIYNQT